MTVKQRLLCLDGGGVRGLLTSTVLERLEQDANFLRNVDCFAGTSTGGLLAVSLALGYSPSFCAKIYKENAERIFSSPTWMELEIVIETFSAKYDNHHLRDVLTEAFQGLKMKDLKKHVILTCFDAGESGKQGWKPRFFSTYNDEDLELSLVEVLLSVTAAPVYFPVFKGRVDGGIAVNNPSVCALSEVMSRHGVSLDDIAVLSLGTGKNDYGLNGNSSNAHWGLVQWIEKGNLLDVMLDGECEVANWQCQRLLGERYFRMDFKLPSEIRLDASDRMDELELIGLTEEISEACKWLEKFMALPDDDHTYEFVDPPPQAISSAKCTIL
jgi:patatin-like phospholipase/acyl hydrolase